MLKNKLTHQAPPSFSKQRNAAVFLLMTPLLVIKYSYVFTGYHIPIITYSCKNPCRL